MTARVDFQARVPIGRVTISGQTFPVIATGEMIRALRTVQDSVNAVESGLTASEISFVPVGSVAATNLQDAVAEVDSEKASALLLTAHTTNTSNPHSTTATQVGLGNVNNTSDANKPVSTAQAAADAAVQAFAIQRGNHTGTQTAATISDFSAAADARIAAAGFGTISTQDADDVAITGGGVLATGAFGYNTGVGGTVTQETSKSTGVALNAYVGEITMHNAALAAGAIVSFDLASLVIANTDLLILNHVGGGTLGAYSLNAHCDTGAATISVRNNTAGSLSEAIVIRFAVIKGAVS